MKIKMNNGDWESLVIVADNFKAEKMTLGDVVRLQKIQDFIKQQLANFLVKKSEIVIKGQAFVDQAHKQLEEIKARHPFEPNHQEIVDFSNEANHRLETDVNAELRNIEGEMVEIDLPEDWYETIKRLFAKQAFFGVNGYNDNPLGHAAFTRTIEALKISLEELESPSNTVNTKEKKKK